MGGHVHMFVNGVDSKFGTLSEGREAIYVLREVPVMNCVGVPVH